jgi:hypothetical protein
VWSFLFLVWFFNKGVVFPGMNKMAANIGQMAVQVFLTQSRFLSFGVVCFQSHQ